MQRPGSRVVLGVSQEGQGARARKGVGGTVGTTLEPEPPHGWTWEYI